MRSPRNRSSKSKSKPGSDWKTIVLVNETSPVPLKVYDPNSPASLSLRRSPRLVPNSDHNANSKSSKKEALVDLNALRKSPRFALSPVSVKSSNANSRAIKVRVLVDPNSLKRSPRLGSTREELKYSNSSREVNETRVLVDPNSLRRSPRLGPIREVRKSSESSKRVNKPLMLVDPSSLRRSSRLVSCSENSKPNDSTPLQGKNLGLVDLNSLRRSPRLFSDPLKSNVGKNQASSSNFEKVRKDSANGDSKTPRHRDTRKSPRFPVAEHGGEKKSGDSKSGRSNGQKLTSMLIQVTPTNGYSLNEKRLRTCRVMKSNTERKSSSFKVVAKTISPTKTLSRKRSFTEMESPKSSNPRTTRAWKGNGETKPMPVKNESLFSGEGDANSDASLVPTDVEVIKEVITEISDEVDMRLSTLSSGLPTEKNIEGNPFDELSDSLDGCPSNSISSSMNLEQVSMDDQEESNLIDLNLPPPSEEQSLKKFESSKFSKSKKTNNSNSSFFVGDAIPLDEARERWGWRYEMKDLQSQGSKRHLKQNDNEDDKVILHVEGHYAQANIRKCIYSLGDCAYIQGDGKKKHVGRIIEFFKTTNGEKYFRVQWFYFVEDTVIQQGTFHDKRRLFYSTIMNDNSLDCIISKVHITKITPRAGLKINSIVPSDFYYDMEYCVDYSTFRSFSTDNTAKSSCSESTSISNALLTTAIGTHRTELELLDLYSGCGGMSTGLIFGAKVSGVNLVTRWAIDYAKSACESLKLNHPETHVRNEAAEDFLELLKEWEKLCKRYRSSNIENTHKEVSNASEEVKSDDEDPSEVFEVSRLLDICYGDPTNTGKHGLKFKVRWKGYDSREDTWEPVDGLSNCEEKIAEFVRNGRKMKILPLPAEVDVICGGPPCQGISGYNRFRNVESPLEDERNRQIIIFMDIVNFLKPKYVLMENVVDILRFDKASLGRYALSRLVHLKYQARLGIIAAGCYGLPQFRLRVFLWGALPHENLPQFPLPTHDVIVRYWPPPEFERNTVAYHENQPRDLEDALVLKDAISDLPEVKNDEARETLPYEKSPETEFQKYIRSTKSEMTGCTVNGDGELECSLNDHRPWPLFEDDYIRVCKIPKRKGANFRDLPGVVVGCDNVARRDPNEEILKVPSGKPLVPEYCFTFEQGKSKRPFARLWWDETVATVLTYPSCHSTAALHPEQDRLLTVREYARLQGFPDSYKFFGTVKERYCQIGNAVPVNVSRALGYSLGMAVRKLSSNEPLLTLPRKFSLSNLSQLAAIDASQDLTSSVEALDLSFIPNSNEDDFSKLITILN